MSHAAVDSVRFASSAFIAWCGTDQGREALGSLARRLVRTCGNARTGYLACLGLENLPHGSEESGCRRSSADWTIRGGIIEFVAGQLAGGRLGNLASLLARGAFDQVPEALSGLIHGHLKDRQRVQEVNPYGALYRRLREALSKDGRVVVKRDAVRRFVAFAPAGTSANGLTPAFTMKMNEALASGFRGWPDLVGSRARLARGAELAGIALDFWAEASLRLGEAAMLPLRSLSAYIASQVDLKEGMTVEAGGRGEDGEETPEYPDHTAWCRPEYRADRDDISACVEELVDSWPERLRLAALLGIGRGLTLQEIAAAAGYAGPSGARQALQRAYDDLRRIVRDLDLDPDDTEAVTLFRDCLVKTCARKCKSPDRGRFCKVAGHRHAAPEVTGRGKDAWPSAEALCDPTGGRRPQPQRSQP